MKKMLMTLAAVLCCVMVTAVFTSCEKDNKYNYRIVVQAGGTLTGDEAVNWTREVMNTYQAALDIDSDDFTMEGSEDECDKHVFETCKKAEASLTARGAGTIKVHNYTTNRTVYRREFM